MNKGRESEFVALRSKWLKERTRLYDRDTGLPTVATLTEDFGKQVQEHGSLAVLIFRPGSEGKVEQVWGWEAYDDLLLDFVRRLKAFQADGIVPGGTFCLPYVRSDEIILIVNPDEPFLNDSGALEQKAAELDQLIRGYLAERADLSGRFRAFVGAGRITLDPKLRAERLIYRGIQEARDQVTRKTVRAEIRGGELLQDAIQRREIYPVFQPVFDLATGEMIGMEALSRGPRGSEFESGETLFSLAERTELLVPLERICRQRSLEAVAGNTNGERQIFMNLSPAAASDPEFLGPLFLEQVGSYGLTPDHIVLEITERTYAVYESLFREVLSKFRSQNFRIAVDDVGTGYSSLSSLAEIEPDYLKFDNVFVRGIDRRRTKQDLLEALLSFARKMRTRVIAEGIETRDELRVLQQLGVPYGQGFLLARPMPLGDLREMTKVKV